MNQKTPRYKNQLRDIDGSSEDSIIDPDMEDSKKDIRKKNVSGRKNFRNLLAILVLGLMLIFIIRDPLNLTINPFNVFKTETSLFSSGPSVELLSSMNARMIEMGYTGLSHDDLRELRGNGVTATYVSNLRAIGFTELTLEEAVKLAKANATTAYISMLIELGYNLTVEEIVMLRDARVTAHFTSNVHDLGFRDVTLDQLVRLSRIGVTVPLIKRLQAERGEDISLEEIIRYRISNQ
ncbi:MAG: hypothetical protein ABR545_06015 [Cyclonatronaceae bacterium]